MAKVTTSDKGIQSTVVIEDKKPQRQAAPALEMKAGDGVSPPVVDGPESRNVLEAKTEASAPAAVEAPNPNDGIDPEDIVELAKAEAEKERKRIGKYVARLRAQEAVANQKSTEAAESERFAEQLFNEREEWRKKAEAAEAKAASLESQKPKEPELVAPKPEDPKYKNERGEFDWLKFSTDNADFAAKKAIAEDRKLQAETQAKIRQEAADAEFSKRLAAAEKKYPDWKQVVTASPVLLQNEALDYIKMSEYGTDLAYYLGKNPEVAGKIKELHPIRAIAELGKLEASLAKQPEKTIPVVAPSPAAERQGAPAPITPIVVQGSNPPPVDPAKMDYKQLRAWHKDRQRQGLERR